VAALLAAKVPLEVLRQSDSLGETCLHVAVCMGFQDVALRIVERGGAEVVGAQNAAGETPLMLAAGSLFGQLLAVSDGTLHCRDW
jgi:ankyrin repeat protein